MIGQNKKKTLLLMAIVFALTAIAAGCSQGGETAEGGSAPATTPAGTASNEPSVVDLEPEEALKWYLQQPDPVPKEKYQIGASLVYLSDPLWVGFQYGIEQQLEKLGLPKPYVTAAGGYHKHMEQIAQVEDLLSRGIDGLLLGPANPDALVTAVEVAERAKVPVVNFAVGINTDKIVTDIQATQEMLGAMTAEYLGKEMNGKGKVYMLSGVAGSSWALGREKGFIEYMQKNHPDIEIVGKHYGKNDRAEGLNAAQDALQANPDIDAFYAGADLIAAGVADAIKAVGKTGQIKVVTMSGIGKDTQMLIKNGEITMSLPYQAVEQGRMLVNIMVRYLNGERNLPKRIGVPVETITKENIDRFDVNKYLAPDHYKPSVAQ
ncbi:MULTISPECIES: TMAO reductase system protein TorT [Paenibacillus]|uniref:TMAO reductase system protein TorT n=1 Tax=Paenibacillus TaxID=44249 RepID=UPI0008822728|nr:MULTISPECIES: TMAO reductase system protein TorT [Paenibacillus]NTZ19987.1 sugar ABC transporter substrate-binding protein [Paenibacillus sp. JMULE4]SDI92779.1 ribose transport system substrate-binding protein [Paenibacillus naphthalenovorans]